MAEESPLNSGGPVRKRSSIAKFTSWIGIILVGLFAGGVLLTIGQNFIFFGTFSHSHVFQNQTLAEVKNRGAVVRPLIDEHQVFDIAASIWSLSTNSDDADATATPLYSDIVFRGLKLSDKHQQVTIPYELPVAAFRRLLLKKDDLRASFVVLPTSPSLADHITNFSSWYPETMKTPPVRSSPFPLGSYDTKTHSVKDAALDSFGVLMPLLEFHELRSNCAEGRDPAQQLSDGEDDSEEDDLENMDDFDGIHDHYVQLSDITKFPQHAVKRHPFVVTRTQLRIVDETHIFNRKAYDKEHKKLKATSCGQGHGANSDYHLCSRHYMVNGNWETRLELETLDEDTGKSRTEWAYAPYMDYASFSSGPKDILPIPVTRVDCGTDQSSSNDPEFMKISWLLSFTGRSPAKFVSSGIFSRPRRVGYHESEYKKTKEHDSAELWNGLYGHRFYDDAHPRRRMINYVSMSVVNFFRIVLDLGYWYSRISTAFISVSGTVFLASSMILSACAHIANQVEEQKLGTSFSQWISWTSLIIMTLATKISLPLLMLKTVTRVEFNQSKSGWFPTVRRVSATHKERKSQRVDSRTTWILQISVFASLVAIYYLLSPDELHILSASIPPRSPEDYPANYIARISALLMSPLEFTGSFSQLLLNHRSKTFAGSFKISVILRAIRAVLALSMYSPSLVGRFDARPGLSVPDAANMLLLAVTMWQALKFPKVIQTVEDEDSE